MPDAPPPTAFSPFRHRAFLVLWVATVIGNVGGWVRDTGSAWMMTELAPSPTMVALVQAAATLPIFLLSLPAGALADILDRRRLMVGIQAGLCGVSLILAILTHLGLLGPGALLGLTFLAGIGAALAGPVWQAVVPELVPRRELRGAVALNSLGINVSRAIGPALAAVVILLAGVPAAYLLDALTYPVIILALWWWRSPQQAAEVPEHFAGALTAGYRYALRSQPLRRVLLRAVLFFAPASACWALLPLVARQRLGGGAGEYGVMLAAVGVGAVAGALLLPAVRRHASVEAVALGAALLLAAATAGLAVVGSVMLACLVLALVGAAWIAALSTFNGAAQAVLPAWVRGRGLAVYLTVFYGAMTGGSLAWGWLAGQSTIGTALLAAAGFGAAGALLARLAALPGGEADLTPSHHWPMPVVAEEAPGEPATPHHGPVMVTIEYRVPQADHAAFAAAARALGSIRRRDGAFAWGVMSDTADPERVVEWFQVASWEEHLRQHGRVSVADREVQQRLLALHRGEAVPAVRHLASLGRGHPGRRG